MPNLDTCQPLPARRADLIVREQHVSGHTAYFVKDPLTLRYFRFAAVEYQLFQELDGRNSLNDLVAHFQRENPDRSISHMDLLRLIHRWRQSGLLIESGGMAAERMAAHRNRQQQQRGLGRLSNLLYLKIHAFDPDSLLNRLYPWFRWMFEPLGISLAFSLVLAAMLLIVSQFDRFVSRPELQSVHAFFTVQNLVWFWLAVGVVKVLHEFGHGLACKHFGGECHAMGLLLMVFTPCLYCDVSDAWMLPSKWQRIAIAAAGIYVEVVIAALATFVWWTTAPGVIHSIAFAAMLFGSVQTILINANPLMRYDGYYALSDFLEVPNLRRKSQALLKQYTSQWFWGGEATAASVVRERGLTFALYAVAAAVYGWLVTVLLIWFLTRFLAPYKLSSLGWGLAGLAFFNIAVVPAVRTISAICTNPTAWWPRRWWRPLLSLIVLAGLMAGIVFLPIPHRVYAVLTIEPVHAERVSASVAGRIHQVFAHAGQLVRQGDPLVGLTSDELTRTQEQFILQRQLLQTQLRTARASLDVAREQQLQTAMADLDSLIELHRRRIKDLLLRAPCDGIVVPESQSSRMAARSRGHLDPLPSWTRTLLHTENIGAEIAAGTVICRVAQSAETRSLPVEAVAILSQRQIELVRIGDRVTIKLEAFPGETLQGSISEIGAQAIVNPPIQLLNAAGGELPTVTLGTGAGRLATPHYQVRIALESSAATIRMGDRPLLPCGLRGRTWVRVGSQPAAMMAWRWLCEIFQS